MKKETVPLEPPAISVRETTEALPVQAAYATLGFSTTRLAHPDLYVLDVLAGILGHGRSSRLYEQLVRKRQVAQVVEAANYTPLDPGAFTIALAIAADGWPETIATSGSSTTAWNPASGNSLLIFCISMSPFMPSTDSIRMQA